MVSTSDRSYVIMAWTLLLGCLVLRILYSSLFLLVPDEAYYWQWSRHLSLGYHDHPPMIAWTIKLATLILGQTETAVRLPTVLALTVASFYLTLAAQRWFGAQVAFYTALLTQSILGFNAAGLLATPDGLLIAGWAGACYHVAAAYETGRLSQWLLGGAWFGFGMLSKYTMVLFPPLAFAFGLFHPQYRRRLAGIGPYAGIVLGILMFMPVIIWNIDSGWSTFRHVAHKGGADREWAIQFRYFGDFVGSQAALLSPLGFVLLLMAWFLPLKKTYPGHHWVLTYLFFTSFPVIAAFALLSLHTRVEGNWAAPGFLGAAVIVAAAAGRRFDEPSRWLFFIKKMWPWAAVTSYGLTLLVLLHLVYPVLPIPSSLDRLSEETTGWDILGFKLDVLQQSMPDPQSTFIFAFKYQDASTLAFYMPGKPETVSINRWGRPNAYDYWWDDRDLIGMDAVGISSDSPEYMERLRQVFATVEPPQKVAIYRAGIPFFQHKTEAPLSEYYIYRAFGFKGGVGWEPRDATDIRAGAPK